MKILQTTKALVVVPAYNEELQIGVTVSEIIKTTNLPVLVVNDASTDDTARKAQRHGARVMTLATQLGAWGAAQTGIRYALRHQYDMVVTMDADGQHDAHGIAVLLEHLDRERADIVIGSCPSRGSWARMAAWSLFRMLSGLSLDDLTSGFRVYTKASCKLLAHRDATTFDYQDVGVLCMLQRAKLRIAETNICMYPRTNGKSRIFNSWFAVFNYMLCSSLIAISHSKRIKR